MKIKPPKVLLNRDIFSRIFRRFGDQVCMARKQENGSNGLDEWGIGHQAELGDASVFIIAESREAELRRLIKNPPSGSVGEAGPHLRVNHRFQYFAQGENCEKKLGMVFFYESPDGKESKKVVFLFGREKELGVAEEGDQNELAEAA